MALPNRMQYGNLQAAPTSISGDQTHQLQPYSGYQSSPLQYSQSPQDIRYNSSTPTVDPTGGGDLQTRIGNLTNSYYAQMQAQTNAQNMLNANRINTGLGYLSNASASPDVARNIYQNAYNAGLVGPAPRDNQSGYRPMGWTSQDNSGSLERQTAAYNNGIYGLTNSAGLNAMGVNPNAVSQAYQSFMNNSGGF